MWQWSYFKLCVSEKNHYLLSEDIIPSEIHANSLRPSDAYIHQQTCSATTHHLTQCWCIVNWTLRNICQWNFISNSKAFLQAKGYENIIYKNGDHLVSASLCFKRLLLLIYMSCLYVGIVDLRYHKLVVGKIWRELAEITGITQSPHIYG